jgi:hypothetical protein
MKGLGSLPFLQSSSGIISSSSSINTWSESSNGMVWVWEPTIAKCWQLFYFLQPIVA